MRLDASTVRGYLDRAWGALEDDTARHRAEMYQIDPSWTWRTAVELRAEVARANPSWPSAEDRSADLAHHFHLCAILERAARGLKRLHREVPKPKATKRKRAKKTGDA